MRKRAQPSEIAQMQPLTPAQFPSLISLLAKAPHSLMRLCLSACSNICNNHGRACHIREGGGRRQADSHKDALHGQGCVVEWEGRKRDYWTFSVINRSGMSLVRVSTSASTDAQSWVDVRAPLPSLPAAPCLACTALSAGCRIVCVVPTGCILNAFCRPNEGICCMCLLGLAACLTASRPCYSCRSSAC